jgi:hypothetical protein
VEESGESFEVLEAPGQVPCADFRRVPVESDVQLAQAEPGGEALRPVDDRADLGLDPVLRREPVEELEDIRAVARGERLRGVLAPQQGIATGGAALNLRGTEATAIRTAEDQLRAIGDRFQGSLPWRL